jgi:hypothetical protein
MSVNLPMVPIHIRHIQSVWAHWYAVQRHSVLALYTYTHPTWLRFLGFWVTCRAEMMILRHGWGWQPPQIPFPIHIRDIQSVWAHWYAVQRHSVLALYNYTHPTWLRFWGSMSHVDPKWFHYLMVEADSHLKPHPPSKLDTYKVFQHIDILF